MRAGPKVNLVFVRCKQLSDKMFSIRRIRKVSQSVKNWYLGFIEGLKASNDGLTKGWFELVSWGGMLPKE